MCLYKAKWCGNTSVKYRPRDVLVLHFIYFKDGCALSQGPGIVVPGTALPQNKKTNFASWLCQQPDGSLGHWGHVHGRSMRNWWKIRLLTSWLPAENGINTGHTSPVAAELWAAEFLTDNGAVSHPGQQPKLEKATRKDHLSLLDLLAPNCSAVTNG